MNQLYFPCIILGFLFWNLKKYWGLCVYPKFWFGCILFWGLFFKKWISTKNILVSLNYFLKNYHLLVSCINYDRSTNHKFERSRYCGVSVIIQLLKVELEFTKCYHTFVLFLFCRSQHTWKVLRSPSYRKCRDK